MELLRRYSNITFPDEVKALLQGSDAPAVYRSTTSPKRRIHAIERRLGPETIAQICQDYEAGTPTTRLIEQYGIGKGTVLRLLRRHGIQLRNQPMTTTQVDQAVHLYQSGLSLVVVGERLGRDQSTIHDALRRAGIDRRDPHGRPR